MTVTEGEEKALVEAARSNPDAFGELFELHYDKIFRYVLRRTGSVAVTEDIVAETFFKAMHKLWQFQWRAVPFSAWLYKIATNEVNAYFRKNRRSLFSLDDYEDEYKDALDSSDLREEVLAAEKEVEQCTAFEEVRETIALLPVRYQEVLTLRFFEEKKVREISVILGKKEGTVKSLLSRGVDQLRVKLSELENARPQPSALSRILENEGREKALQK